MWYVIQVRTGMEENIILQCKKNISDDILKDSFIPYYEEKRRIQGEWIIRNKILFPGYAFLNTEKPEQLQMKLKDVSGLTKLLGTGREVIPLTEEETKFLGILGGEKRIVEMSEGIIKNSKIMILSGPLRGREGYIKKIDRHKRKAFLEISMFGRIQRIQIGLEIISKV